MAFALIGFVLVAVAGMRLVRGSVYQTLTFLWTHRRHCSWIELHRRSAPMFVDGEMLRTLLLLAGMATYVAGALGLTILTRPEA